MTEGHPSAVRGSNVKESLKCLVPLHHSPGALWDAELVLYSQGHTVTLLKHHVIRAFPKHHSI